MDSSTQEGGTNKEEVPGREVLKGSLIETQ